MKTSCKSKSRSTITWPILRNQFCRLGLHQFSSSSPQFEKYKIPILCISCKKNFPNKVWNTKPNIPHLHFSSKLSESCHFIFEVRVLIPIYRQLSAKVFKTTRQKKLCEFAIKPFNSSASSRFWKKEKMENCVLILVDRVLHRREVVKKCVPKFSHIILKLSKYCLFHPKARQTAWDWAHPENVSVMVIVINRWEVFRNYTVQKR